MIKICGLCLICNDELHYKNTKSVVGSLFKRLNDKGSKGFDLASNSHWSKSKPLFLGYDRSMDTQPNKTHTVITTASVLTPGQKGPLRAQLQTCQGCSGEPYQVVLMMTGVHKLVICRCNKSKVRSYIRMS